MDRRIRGRALAQPTVVADGVGTGGRTVNIETVKKKMAHLELSDQQVEEFREAFNEFDIDGDGTITTQVGTLYFNGF